jgi:hypothetical protein
LLFCLCQIHSHVRILIIIRYYTLLYSYNFNPINNTHLRHVTVHYVSRIVQPKAVFFSRLQFIRSVVVGLSQSKIISTISSFSSDNQKIIHRLMAATHILPTRQHPFKTCDRTLCFPYCTTGSRIFFVLDIHYGFLPYCTLCKGSNSSVLHNYYTA